MSRSKHKRKIEPKALRRVLAHFMSHVKDHRGELLVAAAYMLGSTAMELLKPWPLKIIFDGVLFPSGSANSGIARIKSAVGDDDALLAVAVISILLIAAAGGLFRFGQAYHTAAVGQKVVAKVRHQLYGHIQRLSHSFHDSASTGDLIARLTGDIKRMRELLVGSIIYVSDRSLALIGMITIMFFMNWRLTCVAIVIIPMLSVTARRYKERIKGATRKQRRRESEITTTMTEKLSAITVVQAFARESYEEDLFASRNEKSMRAGLRTTRLEGELNRWVEIILAGGTAAVIWFGVGAVRGGSLTPGDLLVFTSYLSAMYKPIRRLASLTSRIAKATVCGERIVSILEIEPEIRDAPDAVVAPPFRGEIEFENVSFGYRSDAPVLTGVSFHIQPGETVALVGDSGVGKSTIADLLLRFYDPVAGRVLIDGVDIRRYVLTSLRDQVGIVLQESILFDATVRENITYGDLDASPQELEGAARIANAHDFVEALPDGYDTIVGERGANLSGGQRQRIAITRAIISNSPLLILDEPMAGLDGKSEKEVSEALAQLMSGRTTLLITHDLEAAAGADRVLQLHDGAITEVSDRADLAQLCAPAAEEATVHRHTALGER